MPASQPLPTQHSVLSTAIHHAPRTPDSTTLIGYLGFYRLAKMDTHVNISNVTLSRVLAELAKNRGTKMAGTWRWTAAKASPLWVTGCPRRQIATDYRPYARTRRPAPCNQKRASLEYPPYWLFVRTGFPAWTIFAAVPHDRRKRLVR